MTIKAPTMLIADLDSCWAAGMAYVMLGRVQNINQLILRWTYDPNAKKDPKEEKRRQREIVIWQDFYTGELGKKND